MIHPTSPALQSRSEHWPARFGDRVPSLIRMLEEVRPDEPVATILGVPRDIVAKRGQTYDVWVNSHGAVVAIIKLEGREERLGVKPHEFIVEEYV